MSSARWTPRGEVGLGDEEERPEAGVLVERESGKEDPNESGGRW